MTEQRDLVAKLFSDSSLVKAPLLNLDIFLKTEETRKDFPYDFRRRVHEYATKMIGLKAMLGDMCFLGREPIELYTKEGKRLVKALQNLARYVGKLSLDLSDYREKRSRNWNDELNACIIGLEGAEQHIKDVIKDADEICNAPTMKKREESPKWPGASALIIILTLGFLTLRLLQNAQVSSGADIRTGFFSYITAGIVGVSLEALYIIVASTIIVIYILWKIMKR